MAHRYLVGFSYKTHFFARAIMWVTSSKFSHCYIVKECDACGLKEVLEANHRGVNDGPYDLFLAEGALGIEEFVVQQDLDALDAAWDQTRRNRLHRPYSYLQILGDALVIGLQTIVKRSLPNPFNQRKADVCSELVLVWLRQAQIEGFDHFDPATVTPEDLIQVFHAKADKA